MNQSSATVVQIRSGDITIPDIVRNLTSELKENLIHLTWDANQEDDLWKYSIYRKYSQHDFVKIAELPAGNQQYVDSTAINEIWYTYAVSAVDSTDATEWDPAYEGEMSQTVTAKSIDLYPL